MLSYLNLASLQMSDNQPQQLLETSNKILRLYPTLSPGHFFHSYANLSLGRVEEAEKQLRSFLKESPKAPNADQIKAQLAELRQQAKAQRKQPER